VPAFRHVSAAAAATAVPSGLVEGDERLYAGAEPKRRRLATRGSSFRLKTCNVFWSVYESREKMSFWIK
jgi:hypothetical protein